MPSILIAVVPYEVHTVLIEKGIHFTTLATGGSAMPLIKEAMVKVYAPLLTARLCQEQHRTSAYYAKVSLANGPLEHVNRIVADINVKH